MPTITAQAILDKAKIVLQDTTSIRWPEGELLTWLNDAQREIASLRPDVSNVTASVALVAGTRQALPSAGAVLIAVRRNMGSDGATPGAAVRKVPLDLLDSQRPGWHTEAQSAAVKHYSFDPRTPRLYYVYPPAVAGTQVELVYDAPPAVVTTASGTITIDDEYANALLEYILFRAYSKDHEAIGNAERAMAHRQLFETLINNKNSSDAAQVAAANVKG